MKQWLKQQGIQWALISSMLLLATVLVTWRATSTARTSGYQGMQLEINDLSNFGVMVYTPDSADFSNKLSSLVTIPADLAADAAKYSIIIENKTPQHISAMEVIWRFYTSQGKEITRSYAYSFLGNQFFDDASSGLIKSGELYPLCLFADSVGFGYERMKELKSTPTALNTLDNIKSLMAMSTRWSFTIDSVLFSNGVWVGPNTDRYVERMTAEINGSRDMLKELAKKLDAGEPIANILAHARTAAGPKDEPPENRLLDHQKMKDPNYLYERQRKNAAREALARHQNLGGDKTLIDWIRGHSAHQIALVKG
jgi:hypothetical protein